MLGTTNITFLLASRELLVTQVSMDNKEDKAQKGNKAKLEILGFQDSQEDQA